MNATKRCENCRFSVSNQIGAKIPVLGCYNPLSCNHHARVYERDSCGQWAVQGDLSRPLIVMNDAQQFLYARNWRNDLK